MMVHDDDVVGGVAGDGEEELCFAWVARLLR